MWAIHVDGSSSYYRAPAVLEETQRVGRRDGYRNLYARLKLEESSSLRLTTVVNGNFVESANSTAANVVVVCSLIDS